MYATIRSYGDPDLADALAARSSEVESLLSSVPGFRAYHLVRTDAGTVTMTVCDDAEGCDESSRRAAEYLREHAPEIRSPAPTIASGEMLLHFAATAAV
jgi:hypothetical protein